MKATFYTNGTSHQARVGQGIMAVLQRRGWQVEMRSAHQYAPSDLAVLWGHRKPRVTEGQRKRGLPYLVAERGYIGDRFLYSSLGYNGLNGMAEFDLDGVTDADRFSRLWGHELHDTRTGGDYALLIGQVPNDAALARVPGQNLTDWVQRMQRNIPRELGLPVRYRPHPQVKPVTTALEDDLAGAAVCVTWNSNSGVIAALRGVPVIACDRGSMAWDVAAHSLAEGIKPVDLDTRFRWACRLAYTQWSPEECADGTAWAHIGRRFERITEAVA